MKVILDIGGEGSIFRREGVSTLPNHPLWGDCLWLTVNINELKAPDIISDATSLNNINAASVDGIYSSHTIEHIDVSLSQMMFTNWFRVLKPGGRVEIRCPDIEWAWREYFNNNLPEELLTELMLGIRTGLFEHHRNMWWGSKLIAELESSGFVNAQCINWGYKKPYIDFWPYDGKYVEFHGYAIIDLLVEGYKPQLGHKSTKKIMLSSIPLGKKGFRRIPIFSRIIRRLKKKWQKISAKKKLSVIVNDASNR